MSVTNTLMNGFKEHSLDQILTLNRRPIKNLDPIKQYQEIGIYCFGKGIFHKMPRSGMEVGDKDLFQIKEGDFILQITFAWEGAIGLVSSDEDGLYCSSRYPTFQVNPQLCYSPYLYNYFRTNAGVTQLAKISPGSAGRNRVLSLKRLSEVKVPLPPLDEQRHIVARIEALAGRVAEAQRLRAEIPKDAQLMLRSAYHDLIVDASYQRMSEVAPLVRRPIEIENEQNYHELGIRSFGKGTFHKPPIKGIDIGTKRIFQIEPGDLLFSNVFAWEGAIAVVKPEDQGRVGSHRFISCVPKAGVATSKFLCFHFLTPKGMLDINEASPGGAGRNRTLGLTKLEAINVPLPSYDRQLWFDSIIEKVEAISIAQSENQTELNALLPAILDKAFRGEL